MAAIPGTSRVNAFAVHVDNIRLAATNWSRTPDYVDSVTELAASIRASGLKTPPNVRALREVTPGAGGAVRQRSLLNEKGEQQFEVAQGARRVAACQQLWASGVRALGGEAWDGTITCLLDKSAYGSVEDVIGNLAENSGRMEADPVARAEALVYLHTEHHLSIDQIAEKTGYARDLVSDSLRLQSAPKAVQAALTAGDLPWSVVRTIVRDADTDAQLKALDAALESRKAGGNVAAARAAANEARGARTKNAVARATAAPNAGEHEAEEAVRRAPGSKRLDTIIEKLEARKERLREMKDKHTGSKKAHSAKVAAEFDARVDEINRAIRLVRAATVVEA